MSLIPSTDVIQLTLTLKMTTEQVVETSVTVNNSPIQDYLHSDNYTQPTYGTHGLLMRMKSKIIKILFPPLVNCVVVRHLHNTFLTKDHKFVSNWLFCPLIIWLISLAKFNGNIL